MHGMDAELIIAELDRVTASNAFRLADRQRSFLRYVVTETIQRRAERLKEYVIGIEVFGRPTSFDPRLDSIVRTEAHKLRGKLAKYFETEGRADPVKIELPRGKYVPDFLHAGTAPASGTAARWTRPESHGLRILVLPFENRAAAKSGGMFCDRLTDELTLALARVPGIEVVARSCALPLKGGAVDICDVARRLNVHAIIGGSLSRLENRIRILVHVDDPAQGCTLWCQSYERHLSKTLDVQQDIAQTIAYQLLPELPSSCTFAASKSLGHRLTGSNPDREAHDHYLQGLRHFARHTLDHMAEASRLFNLTVEKSIRFTQGYTHLAYSYLIRPLLQPILPSELVSRAFAAASKALEIDPLAGEAHIALAMQRIQNYQWREADMEFREGLRLAPSDALGHSWYGIHLATFGRANESIAEHERALELDADAAMSLWSYGLSLFLLRRYAEAAHYFRRTLVRYPAFSQARVGLAMISLQERDYTNAISELERAQHFVPGLGRERAKLGYAYALAGGRDRAREILNEMLQLSDRCAVPAQMIAELYIGLGDAEDAFQWLHKCIAQGDIPPMLCDPIFDPLRSDSRFPALLEHARIPKAAARVGA